MKTIKNTLMQLFIVFLILAFPCVVFAQQDHVITATGTSILSFTDGATTWTGTDLAGSIILSWTDGLLGETINGGNMHLVVQAFPPEGDYKIALKTVTYSDPASISGVWEIKKNNAVVCGGSGCTGDATGLDGVPGTDSFDIVITDGLQVWKIKSIIGYKFNGLNPLPTVKGTIYREDLLDPIAGVKVKVRYGVPGSPAEVEKDVTTDEGTFVFNIPDLTVDTYKKTVIAFKNTDADVTFKGYIGLAGSPLANAVVTVSNQDGVLATVAADANGLWEVHIVGATGPDKNKIKIVITKP